MWTSGPSTPNWFSRSPYPRNDRRSPISTRSNAMKKCQVGDRLPELNVPVTTMLVASGAIATRDFQPVHHNRGAARAAGTKDIFMNMLTTNGLVGRYSTEWAGPYAQLSKMKIGLGAPNFPGDC